MVVEQSERLAAHLRQRFAAVPVLQGDAAELPQLLARLDDERRQLPVLHIVSGLPLLSIPAPVRQRILHAGAQALAPQGRLVQFTYALRGESPWQSSGLVRQHSERVLANLPPARIDVLGHGARHTGSAA